MIIIQQKKMNLKIRFVERNKDTLLASVKRIAAEKNTRRTFLASVI